MNFIWFILIGLAAGYLAGVVMKGSGFGLIGDLIVGVIGAVLGGWLFPKLGIDLGGELVGSLITATLGAILFLFLLKLIKKNT